MSLIEAADSLKEIKKIALQALNRAGNDRRSAFRFIIFNTFADKYPNSRYVVLRNFDVENLELTIYTDFRSNKITEIKDNPKVSVLAYYKQKKCQIKLKAIAAIHHQDEVAAENWNTLSSGKDPYNTKNQPGMKKDVLEEAQQMKDEFDSQHFAVVRLKIQEMEVLQLNSEGHIRVLFDLVKSTESYLVP